ncbi:MAG: Ig-like domain-containing protein [Ruminiclostridium sp.]|nr:Ig-like domain-containing protein [Ruminiclostridium sp.]
MSKFRKMTAVLLSVVMLVCCFAVNVSAAGIADTAKAIESGKTYTAKLYKNGEQADYKIVLSKDGDLKLNISTQMYRVDVYLYDSNGNSLGALDLKADSGSTGRPWSGSYIYCQWNSTVEKYVGSFKYSLEKGTYYLRFERYGSTGSEKVTFKATYPSSGSSSEKSKAECINVPLKKGSTMQLSVDTKDTVKWSSSDKSIAEVSSSGKVTAKKKGTAVITAKTDSSTLKIGIKVS